MPHIHEKIDFTVEVFIVFENRVLLRKHDKYGIWLSTGGHIELNEDPNQAAIREVKEEVGLDIVLDRTLIPFEKELPDYKELIPPKFLNRHLIKDEHEHVTLTYFATTETDILSPSEEEKSKELKWFTKEDLDSTSYDLKDSVRFYAKKALEELSWP